VGTRVRGAAHDRFGPGRFDRRAFFSVTASWRHWSPALTWHILPTLHKRYGFGHEMLVATAILVAVTVHSSGREPRCRRLISIGTIPLWVGTEQPTGLKWATLLPAWRMTATLLISSCYPPCLQGQCKSMAVSSGGDCGAQPAAAW
jgi:hypothetical protein